MLINQMLASFFPVSDFLDAKWLETQVLFVASVPLLGKKRAVIFLNVDFEQTIVQKYLLALAANVSVGRYYM